MVLKLRLLVAISLASCLHTSAFAISDSVRQEVELLLNRLDSKSNCEFKRNGSWHNADRAREHLRTKLDWLVSRNLVQTTEQFIERAASKSSLTGQDYQVRCPGEKTVTAKQWWQLQLLSIRKE